MQLADLGTPSAKIQKALESLQIAWGHATEHWDDANSRYFEEKHLLPMAMSLKFSLDAVGRMEEALHRSEAACLDQAKSESF